MLRHLLMGVLLPWLSVTPVYLVAQAPTDEELKALEQKIEQQEAKQKAEAETKKRTKAEAKRKTEEERRKREEEAAKQAEEEKRKAEEAEKQRHAEEDQKRIQDEAKRLVEEELKRKQEEASRPSVRVIFFRPWKYIGSLGDISILYKGHEVGVLPTSSFFTYLSPAGEQPFTVGFVGYAGYTNTQNFEFEPDQTYYIKAEATFGGAALQLVTEVEGSEAIKRYADTGNKESSKTQESTRENKTSKNPLINP